MLDLRVAFTSRVAIHCFFLTALILLGLVPQVPMLLVVVLLLLGGARWVFLHTIYEPPVEASAPQAAAPVPLPVPSPRETITPARLPAEIAVAPIPLDTKPRRTQGVAIVGMAGFFASSECKLRPHFKAHKTPEIARRQLAGGSCTGLTCATVGEAEVAAEFCRTARPARGTELVTSRVPRNGLPIPASRLPR